MPRLSLTVDPAGSRSGLSDLQRATNSTIGALQRLTRELDRADAGLEEVGREAQRTGQRADQTRGALARLSTTLGTVGAGISSVRGALFSLQGAFAAIGGGLIIRGFVDLADAATQAENRLKLVTDGTEELAQVQSALFEISQRTRTEFTAQAELYGRLGLAARDLGASQNELLAFTEGIGQALTISGASAQTARGALIQLSQAIGSGTVRAEEYNSVLEGAPRILQAVAAGFRGTGVSVSELRNLVIDGEVSSREFFDAFLSQSDQLEREFGQTTRTVGQAMVQLRNELLRVTGDTSEATGATAAFVEAIDSIRAAVASDGFSRGLTIFANTLALVAENLDVAAVAAGVFLTALAPWSIVIGAIAGGLALLANNLRDATSETRDLERAVEAAIDAEERARAATEGLSGAALENATTRLKQAEATRVAAQAEAAYQQAIQASIAVDEARARLNDPVAAGITGPGAIGSIDVTNRLRGELEAAQDAFFEATGAANKLRGESEALESEVAKLAVSLGGGSSGSGGGGGSGGVGGVAGSTRRAADAATDAEKEFKVLGLTVADVPAALAPLSREFAAFDQRVREFEAQPFLNALEDIQTTLTDTFEDAFRGSLDSLKDFGNAFLDILARLGANIASQQIVIPITAAAGAALGVSSQSLGIPDGVSTGFGGALDAITGVGSGLFDAFATSGIGQALGLASATSTLPGTASQIALTGLGSTLSSVAGFALPALGLAIPLLSSLFGPNPPSNAVATQFSTASGAARVVDPDGEFSDENLARSRELAGLGLSELTRLANATGTGIPFREVAGDISDRDGEFLRLTGANTPGGRIDALIESSEDVTRAVLGGFLEQVEGLGPQLRAAFEGLGDLLTAEIADIERVISGAEIFTSIKAQLDALDQETAGPFETTLTGLRAQWDEFRTTLEAANLPTERLNTLIALTTQELQDNFIDGLERTNRELRGLGFIDQVLDGLDAFQTEFSDADFFGDGAALVRDNLELALNQSLGSLDLKQLGLLEQALIEANDGTEAFTIALREVGEAQDDLTFATMRSAQSVQEAVTITDVAFESTRGALEELAEASDIVSETADRATLAVDALADRFSSLDQIQEGLLSRTQGEAAARDFRLVSAGLGEFTDELRDLAGSSGIGQARVGLEDFLGLARSTALTTNQLELAAREAFGVFDSLSFDTESPADALRRQTEGIAAAASDAYSSLFVSLNTSLTGFATDLAGATDATIAQIDRIYSGAISRAEASLDRASQARGIAGDALLSLAAQQSTPEARFAAINDEFQFAADRASGGQLGAVQALADLTDPFLDALGGEFRRGTPEFFEGLTQAQDAFRTAQEAAAEQEARATERLARLTRDSRDFAEDARNLQRQLLEQQTAAVAQQLAKAQEMIDALVAQLAETVVGREEARARLDALIAELRAVKGLTQRQNTLINNLEENARRSAFG